MGEKITQTMALEVWTLTTPADMFECLEELVEHGYRGEIKCYPLEVGKSETPVWFLELNSGADKPSVTAILGQTVVLFGGVLESMAAEIYAARFG